MEIATAKGSWHMHVVAFVTPTAVQHFSNKTGPNILVNVISPYHRVDSKGFYYLQLRRHCTCSIPRFYTLESTCFMFKGFADILIADITAGQINHYFAEIAPRTVYPLYGITKNAFDSPMSYQCIQCT